MPTIAELKAALTDPRYYAEVGQGLLDSFNRGAVGGLLGTPVDMANGVVNAGKMAAGYVGHKTGLLSPGQMPQPDTAPIGGSEWWGQKMQDAGMVSGNRNIPAEMLMGVAGIPLTGAAAAKVMPKVEQGLLAAAKNAVNPATLNVPAYGGQRGAIVWHGTPHKFDKFDMSKIGTGEGAQAYGHGLYMAESPDVAKSYQTALASDRGFSFGGKSGLTRAEVQDMVNSKYGNVYLDNVIRPSGVADSFIDDMVTGLNRPDGSYPRQYKPGSQRAKVYDELRGQITHADPGSLYKVDIPDEAVARFLDWDKPLSQQAPEVQAALKSMTDDVTKGGFDLSRSPRNVARAFDDSSTEEAFKVLQQKYGVTNSGGQYFDKNGNPVPTEAVQRHIDKIAGKGYDNAGQLYSDLTHILGSQSDISATLRNNGIPGIRYLDGGSRGEGQGTSNFVLFSDDLARILERNGAPTGLEPWKPGEWSAK